MAKLLVNILLPLGMILTFTAPIAVKAQALTSGPLRHDASEEDSFLWLEDVMGDRALTWVDEQNARSLPRLESDSHFNQLKSEALEVLTSQGRIPFGQIQGDYVYNSWQDDQHVRGLWRRATLSSYRTGHPEWETLIDYDKLATDEGQDWVMGGASCLNPEYRHCMISMSLGGKDASIWREYDLATKSFVSGGFALPEAKSDVSWLDENTLWVATITTDDTKTTSGYARILYSWKRGVPFENAGMIFTGEKSDMAVSSVVYQGDSSPTAFVVRIRSFYDSEYSYFKNGQLTALPLPQKVQMAGVLKGRIIFTTGQEWTYQGVTYSESAILAYDLKRGKIEKVFEATGNMAIQEVDAGDTGIVVQYLDDVVGKAARVKRNWLGKWVTKEIPVPPNGVVKLKSIGGGADAVMLSFESLTTPNQLYYVDAHNRVQKIAEAPSFYDSSDVVVERHFAISADGTKVPYFVMGKKEVLEKGPAPTIQYAYGGFLISTLPLYYDDPARPQDGALAGKMWVSRGGVLVLSSIRGGAEYGPKWHDSVLKENRQKAFDDFFAVSNDLIARHVTTPRQLGAIGRSNGGLLMGVVLTQHPELYHAIDCGVPLFDMKRYTNLGAGASWIGEYGDPEIPEQWDYISKYSPYQNLKAGQPYPKVLFYTSTQDDRVHPGHARKAAARLQELGYDFYYYENKVGGHSGTADQEQLAYRTALEFTYFFKELFE